MTLPPCVCGGGSDALLEHIDARFPHTDMIDNFKVFSPSYYVRVADHFDAGALPSVGTQPFNALLDHFGVLNDNGWGSI